MDNEIKVSICCITYNQEKYIRDAIESFLKQKTNFKFEVIIRDDASQDNTANIIREYEEKYPDIIHGIYEKVNGFSNGVKRAINITFEKARGKYIAICEGDDYWIDENKLQLQYDYMEEHPKCSFCFHNAILYDEIKKRRTKKFIPGYKEQKKYLKRDNNYNLGELALLNYIPTASYFFYNNKEWPEWYFNACVGDVPIQLIRTNDGYAHYIDKIMSVYRVGTNISIMDAFKKENKNNDINKIINRIDNFIYIYESANKMSNYKYNEAFKKLIEDEMVLKIIFKRERNLNDSDKRALKNANLYKKIKYFVNTYFCGFYQFLKKIKYKIIK